jgi:1-aminocyclopropane-1-carboxylate deaminase
MYIDISKSPLQPLYGSLWIKRDDLIDPIIGGNKFRKLKYNVARALELNKTELLTFGGAYSNHILATARAGELATLKTIGIIRGHAEKGLSPVLCKAHDMGMQLEFVSREDYKLRGDHYHLDALQAKHPSAYIIPEGGTNTAALKGVAEIRHELPDDTEVIAVACGSGGTLAGLITAYADRPDVSLLGFSVLKGEDQLTPTIKKLLKEGGVEAKCQWRVITGHHFGGYAKAPQELTDYMRQFKAQHDIALDYVYTGKMMFGLEEWLKTHPEVTKAVALHTGGLFTASLDKTDNKVDKA